MLTNYYTLRALIDEWAPRLAHSRVVDSYSQHKGSLIVVFETPESQKWSLNASVQAPNRHLFMYSGVSRSRKNVVDVFPNLRNQEVSGLELAERDRLVSIRFFSGDVLHFAIYGPNANAFVVQASSLQVSSFRGTVLSIPELRPAPPEPTEFEIEAHLRSGRPLKSLLPLFPATLIDELWTRAGSTQDPRRISGAISEIIQELNHPQALVYWSSDRKPLFSTIALHSISSDFQASSSEGAVEKFNSVDEAVCVCARRRLAITRFSIRYDPLLKIIQSRSETAQNRLGRVIAELNKPSRSETHENMGHLLMAQPHKYQSGSSVAIVPDLISGGADVEIPMDPLLTAIENATQYYEKAKAARAAREVSKDRLQALQKTATELQKLLDGALNLKSEEEVAAFETQHSSWLKTLQTGNDLEDSVPYRRFVLEEGYEVWVGRNAKQNDQLTLHDARKYDLWLHARGVAGSHTVLRLRGQGDKPPHRIIEQAAAIAAWFSKARPSALVPVIVVERKYVRKPRKSLPGTVVVEREKVLLVEPKLPG